MTKRIIDNKKIDLTESEWKLYQKICTSYDKPNFQGKDLFAGLFETDDNGKIIFLIPPVSKHSSMEVFMFLVSIMVHQHVGQACVHVNDLRKELQLKINEATAIINDGRLLLEDLKKVER